MKFFAFLVFGLALVGIASSNEELDLESTENKDDVPVAKRSTAQLFNMIREFTGTEPKNFLHYGCWCGDGGKGEPVDDLDRCCQIHDKCYDSLYQGSGAACSSRSEVDTTIYYHSGLECYAGELSSRCARGLCYCDVAAVKCFKNSYYYTRYMNWDKNSCS